MTEPTPNRPPDGSVRVALSGTVGGHPWTNRFWLNVSTSSQPTGSQLLALSNAVAASYRTRFVALFSDAVVSNHQRCVLYYNSTTEIGVDGSDTGTGARTGNTIMPQACYLINWAISGTYRGGHPRTYLPGAQDVDVGNSGAIGTSPRGSLSTAAGNFLSDVNALSPSPFTAVALGTIRFFRHNTALSPPVFEPFLSGTCNATVATQRRRVGR